MPDEAWNINLDFATAALTWGKEVAPIMERALRDEAPEGAGITAGRLKNSIVAEVAQDGGDVRVEGSSDVPEAAFVVYGTVPHEIVPRNAKVLRFEVGGQTVFSRHVSHPGTKANPFNERAEAQIVDEASAMLSDMVAGSIRVGGAI